MKKQILNTETQFYQDLLDENKVMNVNGKEVSRGYWNLILSIRDCGLYSKGIKPHRFWKISNVKAYFGVKGSPIAIHEQLQDLHFLLNKVNQ